MVKAREAVVHMSLHERAGWQDMAWEAMTCFLSHCRHWLRSACVRLCMFIWCAMRNPKTTARTPGVSKLGGLCVETVSQTTMQIMCIGVTRCRQPGRELHDLRSSVNLPTTPSASTTARAFGRGGSAAACHRCSIGAGRHKQLTYIQPWPGRCQLRET